MKVKYEYEVLITYTEVHSVFVEADDEEEAKERALDAYYDGKTEMRRHDTEAVVNWSNEEG